MDTSVNHRSFLLLLGIVSAAFCWLMLPYYGAVLWAVILAIIFQPMQRWLENRLYPRRNLPALCSTLICVVIAVIPVGILVASLVAEGTKFYQQMQDSKFDISGFVTELRADLPPEIEQWLQQVGIGNFDALREKLSAVLMQGSQLVAGQALSIGQNTLHFFVSAGIMLYLLFFLFRDGQQIGRNILASMPLSKRHGRALLGRFAAVVKATVRGNVIIAAIQGMIGGVTFWALGTEGALLWGVLMAFMAMVPAVGAAIVWGPAAAYMLITGDYVRGLILIGVGVGVIGLVDNLLRPPLVGKDTKLPDYMVLISTIGGISIFGVNGFVIGPMIAALFVASWTLFRDEQAAGAPMS